MRASDTAYGLIRAEEGYRRKWYKPIPSDPWTVGYGCTEGAVPGLTRSNYPEGLTRDEAEHFMRVYVATRIEPVLARAFPGVDLHQNCIDALVCWAYNVGEGELLDSDLSDYIRAGKLWKAAAEFSRWVYSAGKKIDGLVNRRQIERALFEQGIRQQLYGPPRPTKVEPLPLEMLPGPDMTPDQLPKRY